jgi:TMEM175 potassium channel family protein
MAQAMDRGRLEAFSDGVLAVAITLLVLDLHVETGEGRPSLAHQLGSLWPQITAYVVSFLVIGVIWVNHHALCLLIGTVDRTLLFVNLVLLLFVTTMPFTTSVLADFIREGGADARWAVLLYGVSNTGMAFAFTAMLHRMVSRNLLLYPVPRDVGARAVRRFGLGSVLYPVSALLGVAWPPLVLVLTGGLAMYYVFEHTAILPSDPASSVSPAKS